MHVNVTEFDSDIVRVCGFIAGLGETEVEKKIHDMRDKLQ